MNNGFNRFKKKLFVGALTRSLILGASSGAFVSALIVLIEKLSKASPNMLIYLPVGFGVALIFSSLLFTFLYPSDRRVAKKLDSDLRLGEKAQTMIEFRGKSGDVTIMQRQDTERILSEIPTKDLKIKNLWIDIIMPILAIVMIISAFLVPTYTEAPPPTESDPDFEFSPWQEQALKDLIEEVKKSDMEASPRNAVVSELEGLLTELRAAKKVSVMKASVIGVIKAINEAVDSHNSYIKIASALSKSESDAAKSIGSAISTLSAITLGEELTEIRAGFSQGSDTLTISAAALQIKSALTLSGVGTDDPLYVSLDTFAGELSAIAASGDTLTEQAGQELDGAFATAGEKISSALLLQYTNERVGDNTILRLMQIFGIKESELPSESRPSDSATREDEGDYNPEDNDDPLHSGGFGSGDMIFGSDDMIYDPELGKYVSYGEVINKYYAKISEQILDGNLSHELEQLLSDYFAFLFDGSGNDGE